ncbi:MAG: N-Acetyl-D-glucosamine ABC transport system, permease protein 1 [Candidatus Carbobacillus altaicus]|uniref:N-Acetyl-D-glucosamine ABC transport system, permease protein 1 n=1 Tax=Candidatus Carbonibacillus altaicus TaxID=2163959 RepID=A0A2R6Y1U5_9BACL|nr:MAG: N-Acetyl-D-glucosamine ABC transport system, permease protein 1 [Candidatus Carbobacillus altaicus]
MKTLVPYKSEKIKYLLKDIWKNRVYYLFLAPKMVVFTLFIAIPVIWAFILAFQEYNVFGSTWVGLNNFIKVLNSEVFYVALWNTFKYTVFTVPVHVVIALILATLIHPLGKIAQSFFRAAFYLPTVTSMVIIAMVWRWIYNFRFGLFNYFLSWFGIPPVDWLGQSATALWAIIIMSILTPPGVGIILYLAAMSNIPDTLYEAAKIDGAGPFQRWYRITLPMLKPTTLYLVMISTIGSFQVFTQIIMMTKGGPGYATETLVHLIYKTAFRDYEFGVASAQAMILFIIILFFSVIQYRLLSTDHD